MILTAPAMMSGNTPSDVTPYNLHRKEGAIPHFTSTVIKKFVDHPTVIAMRAVPRERGTASYSAVTSAASSSALTSAASSVAAGLSGSLLSGAAGAATTAIPVTAAPAATATLTATVPAVTAARSATAAPAVTATPATDAFSTADARSAELKMVIRQAGILYTAMDLQDCGLDPKAFEYAWRGYHNLAKKGLIHKRAILSICDFSQSSRNKRMYVIDVQRRRLLYRTYVAHGQNSGDEYASEFSNQPDSYKSSLGFYITMKTYVGRNGLSLRLDGVDPGYNDMAIKRQIVLHGSSYVGEKYMQDYGNLGTSLGCPALPTKVSGRIIRAVKDGSVLFIYHPTQQYLDNSAILHG